MVAIFTCKAAADRRPGLLGPEMERIEQMNMESLEPDELLALARLDFEKERFDQALARTKLLASNGGALHVDALALLGAIYARLKLWSRAQVAFEGVLRQRPDATNERFQLGMTHFDRGGNGAALEVWAPLSKGAALHPPALYYSALAEARLGHLKVAQALCETILGRVEADNLFYGRAKTLSEQMRKDPRAAQSEAHAGGSALLELAADPGKSH